MNKQTFLKLSAVVLVAAMFVLGGVSGSAARSAQQATMPATMPGGMMPPSSMSLPGMCPPGLTNGIFTAMKGMMTAGGMMATMPAMMGTMPAMPPGGMMPTMPAMPGGMMPTMPAMMGTMPAMPPGMMNQTCLIAFLSGKNEVPGPGDAKGYGVVTVSIDTAAKTVTFEAMVADLKLPATASHIHKAAAGAAGGVVVDAKGAPDAQGMFKATVTVTDDALLADIVKNPSGYYYNVHNADFPGGAIRGQLGGMMDMTNMLPGAMMPMPNPPLMTTMVATPAK